MPAVPPVVLHPSSARLVLHGSAPLLVALLGLLALLDGGPSVASSVLLLLGLALAAIVLLDLPYAVEFDDEGITRRCVLREHRLPWSQVVALTRSSDRPGLGDLIGRARGGDPRPVGRRAGLVARRGARSNVLLVDRCESHAEWAALRDLLKDRATAFSAPPPPADHPPAGRGPRALHTRR